MKFPNQAADDESVVLNVITPFDFLSIVAECLPFITRYASVICQTFDDVLTCGSSEKKRSLRSLGLAEKEVLSVKEDDRVIDVIRQTLTKPYISAVPVLDNSGNIVATFSASNLKVIQLDMNMNVSCSIDDIFVNSIL
jgi:predicted transcriptional regulator